MKVAEIECEVCGEKFLRRTTEVNRNAEKGMRTYCSPKCVGAGNHTHLEYWKRQPPPEAAKFVGDELSPFRNFLKSVRSHCKSRGKTYDITLEDLKEQWEKQNGLCPFTGKEMQLAVNSSHRLDKTPDRASLDRIDSSKPYVKDNIQFVSMMAQYAKNEWDGNEVLTFCEAVTKHHA